MVEGVFVTSLSFGIKVSLTHSYRTVTVTSAFMTNSYLMLDFAVAWNIAMSNSGLENQVLNDKTFSKAFIVKNLL